MEHHVKFLCGDTHILKALLAPLVAERPLSLFPRCNVVSQSGKDNHCPGSQSQNTQSQEKPRMTADEPGNTAEDSSKESAGTGICPVPGRPGTRAAAFSRIPGKPGTHTAASFRIPGSPGTAAAAS